MVQAVPQLITLDEFLDWYPDGLGLGGRRHIGTPKQPTFTVCTLVDGEYELRRFRGNDRIISAAFPGLTLTAEQVFASGQ